MEEIQKIKHLYSRAGFGFSLEEWKEVRGWTFERALDYLMKQADAASFQNKRLVIDSELPERGDREAFKERVKEERKMVMRQNVDWVMRMGDPGESCFLEKMCFFWHGHFACTTKLAKLAAAQLESIREHAFGNFRVLVKAMARDVSMIRFLNNQQNKKRQPNENFARELMELFTIGRGNYSEQDIKEAARAFTGWSSNLQGEFVFRKFQHDYGQKVFMGQTGEFDGDEIIDIILENPKTAEFIARKAYRFFVNPIVNDRHVSVLADQFYRSDYDIKTLLRGIFESEWFYESVNIGVKIKSPVELIAGMIRALRVSFSEPLSLVFAQKALGQVLFAPPNVAGWPGGKSWIDNATLMLRLNLVHILFDAAEVDIRLKERAEEPKMRKGLKSLQASIDLKPFFQVYESMAPDDFLDELINYLLPANSQPNRVMIKQFVRKSSTESSVETMIRLVMNLPEYQLC